MIQRESGTGKEVVAREIQRATVLADSHDITLDDLPSEVADCGEPNDETIQVAVGDQAHLSGGATTAATTLYLDDMAKSHVLNVLAQENGNKASAARKLGIHRRKLYRLLERFERTSGG